MRTFNSFFRLSAFIFFICGSYQVQAQLDCSDKGHFYFYHFDSYAKKLYVSNIIKGDAISCVGDKKMYYNDKKVKFFRDGIKATDPDANGVSGVHICPSTSGENPRTGKLVPNDYESVNGERENLINAVGKEFIYKDAQLFIVELNESDFQ